MSEDRLAIPAEVDVERSEAENTMVGHAPVDGALLAACEKARELLGIRRRRNEMFGSDGFASPAWEIMLELFVAKTERRLTPVKSACIGAGVPMSMALRWVNKLADEGVIIRRNRSSSRRYMLELDDDVTRAMAGVLLGA